MQAINEKILFYLNSFIGHFALFDFFWLFITKWLGPILILVALIFWLFHRHKNETPIRNLIDKIKEFFFVFFYSSLGWFFVELLKNIIQKPRPFAVLSEINPLYIPSGEYGMPSGHALFFLLFAILVYKKHKKLGLVFIILAILIGISRIVAGVHYPIDVLVGWGLAGVFAFFWRME